MIDKIFKKIIYIKNTIDENRVRNTKGLRLGNNVKIYGLPIIDIKEGNIEIGDNVTLNSNNNGYHLNMHSPVKLFVDKKDAIIRIGSDTRIHGTCIHAYQSITIGERCLIAANCHIIDNNGHDLSFHNVDNRINTVGNNKPVIIEDSVWIGANSIILPGVVIGKGSIIGAGSVVTKDVPSMVVAAGNPAVIIKNC